MTASVSVVHSGWVCQRVLCTLDILLEDKCVDIGVSTIRETLIVPTMRDNFLASDRFVRVCNGNVKQKVSGL